MTEIYNMLIPISIIIFAVDILLLIILKWIKKPKNKKKKQQSSESSFEINKSSFRKTANSEEKPISSEIKEEKNLEDFKGAYKKVNLMSKNEYLEYKKIFSVAQKLNLNVFPKVRLADIIQPTARGKQWQYDFSRIRSKHCDFALCNNFMDVVAIIEIDDLTHDREDRIQRDKFVDFILKDCKIKVLRYRYTNPDIFEELLRKQLHIEA